MSALGLAELADRTLLAPDGWSVLVVEEARLDATTRELTSELTSLLAHEGTGEARVFSESRVGARLIEALAQLGPDDVAVLPLAANLVAAVSHALDYGRGRLLGHPRGMILTSEAGVRVLAAEAPNFWSWVGPLVWLRAEPPTNDNERVGTQGAEAVRGASSVSSRLVRINGVLTIDLGMGETIPADVFEHRVADDDEHDERLLRGLK